MSRLHDLFESFNDDFLKFEGMVDKRSTRRDIHAFLLLEEIAPSSNKNWVPIICASEHDEIWLDTDCAVLADKATPEQIHELVRCGVMYSDEYDCLSMFA
jgi:hypothetical protein